MNSTFKQSKPEEMTSYTAASSSNIRVRKLTISVKLMIKGVIPREVITYVIDPVETKRQPS